MNTNTSVITKKIATFLAVCGALFAVFVMFGAHVQTADAADYCELQRPTFDVYDGACEDINNPGNVVYPMTCEEWQSTYPLCGGRAGDIVPSDPTECRGGSGSCTFRCGVVTTRLIEECTPIPECSDGYDNDGDGAVDADDAGCHTDGNAGNPGSYNPNDDDEYNPICNPPGWGPEVLAFDGWNGSGAFWCSRTSYGPCTSGEGGTSPSAYGSTGLCCTSFDNLGYIRSCQGVPYTPYSCTGSIPDGASAWGSDEDDNLGQTVPWTHSPTDTANKCQFKCDTGTWNGSVCEVGEPVSGPTANLTVNGVSSVTVAPGANLNYAWSSTNGIAWSSTWSASGSCGDAGSSGAWAANNSGGTSSGVAHSSQAGCTYTITYNVTGSSGSASDSITVTIEAGAPPPVNSCQGGIPSGGSAWDSEESSSLTNNTTYWTHSSTDTSTKCQFRCTSGSWNSATGQCVSEPPAPEYQQLTLLKAGSGQGTVISNDGLINCGPSCSSDDAWYNDGRLVTLTAYESQGSNFSGWSGTNVNCPGTGSCTVSMALSRTVTATFSIDTEYLSVTKTGTGSGVVTSAPSGINCGGDCGQSYVANTTVTLTAVPDAGSTFDGLDGGWDAGDCDSYTATTCTVTMYTNRNVDVSFGGTGSFPDLDAMRPSWTWGSNTQGSSNNQFISRTYNDGPVSTGAGFVTCFRYKWGDYPNPWPTYEGTSLGCNSKPALAGGHTGASTDYSSNLYLEYSGPFSIMYCADVTDNVYEGPDGEDNNCAVRVYNVNPNPSAPVVTLTANPMTIAQGDSSTLTWSVSNATACTATNQDSDADWSGAVAFSGTNTTPVMPDDTTWYRIECSNASSYVTRAEVTVNVQTPDLTSKNLSLGPGPHYRNSPMSNITAQVENVGPVGAGAFTDRFRYQWNGTGGIWRDFTNNTVSHNSGLGAGLTANDGPVSYTPTSLGTLYIQHCVDSGNTVSEGANTAPNCTQIATNITDAPVYSCGGSIPPGAARWDSEEETAVPQNTFWSYANPDTSTKCQYRCTSGVPIGGRCVDGTIDATPEQVLSGSISNIFWSLTNADGLQCRVQGNAGADNWDAKAQTDHDSTPINANTTYILSCENSPIVDVDVTVITGPTLRPDPRVIEEGDPVDLIYNTGGQDCTLNGGPVNNASVNSAVDVPYPVSSLEATTTFTLTCPVGDPVTTTVEVVPKGYET